MPGKAARVGGWHTLWTGSLRRPGVGRVLTVRFVASPVFEGSSRGFLPDRPEFAGRFAFSGYNANVLNGKQLRHLRGLGHELKAIVQIGRDGIDDGVVDAVNRALTDHELIKVRLGEAVELDRHEAAEAIASRTGSEVAQVLGNTLLLYRADPENPAIVLP